MIEKLPTRMIENPDGTVYEEDTAERMKINELIEAVNTLTEGREE